MHSKPRAGQRAAVGPARGFFASGTIFLKSIVGDGCETESARTSAALVLLLLLLPVHTPTRREPARACVPVCRLYIAGSYGSTQGRLKKAILEHVISTASSLSP